VLPVFGPRFPSSRSTGFPVSLLRPNKRHLLLSCARPNANHRIHEPETDPGKEKIMTFLRMVRVVLWSFFGVRKRASHEADFAHVKLPLLPVVAFSLAACFGGTLFCVAHFVVAHSH
jgi:hypothetical protein